MGAVQLLSRDGEALELAYASGYSEEAMHYLQRVPLSQDVPGTVAVLEGQPMWFDSREALVSRYPQLALLRPTRYEASAIVPLLAEERRLGLLSISFLEVRQFTAEQQDLMLIMARHCSQALERARLYQETQQVNAQLEQRVTQRTVELERSLKELDQFTYIASHDLKAPLRGVKQLATWIVQDADNVLPENSKIHLAKLQGRIERMERLLNDLLMYSRVSRKYYSSTERVDTRVMVKEVIEMLAPSPTFAVTVQEGMPTLTTSRTPLELIFKNLIENALKHHHRSDCAVIPKSATACPAAVPKKGVQSTSRLPYSLPVACDMIVSAFY
jgi:signal transduction histidine kinase